MKVHAMWDSYPELKQDLADVLSLIDSRIHVRNKAVEERIKEMVYSGGKLLRPAFTLLCSNIGPSYKKEDAIAVSAAIECLHLATLIHDDVIDEASHRRGVQTIHADEGNKIAIYAGDYLFSVCFTILANHATSLADLEFNARGMEKILSGELEQLNSRYQFNVSVKDYLTRIAGKTAQLFAISCYSGAVLSQSSRRVAMISRNIGHNIGMAFQIKDDILDYRSDFSALGKPVMSDIRQGIYNLPLIYVLQNKPSVFHDLLAKGEAMTDHDLEEVMNLVDHYHGLEKAEQLAEKYTDKAIKQLKKLPNGEYKSIIQEVMATLLVRSM
ncbi:polyprenyl synthetase family protein [Oceanobacillus sp. AG]|uniref:polyprenyl synthetase family protein n=1 Tax=Oceanobacillus sp. AG TaxID=2681969 RepID=UPI0012EB5F4F|nr:polyprenyl synthetase family protein [Oceanobacillus sp. AG]